MLILILTIIHRFPFCLSLGNPLPSSSPTLELSMALTAEEFLRISTIQRTEDAKLRAEERAASCSLG